MKKGLLIVISGASGTGKGTVCKELLTREPAIAYSISATDALQDAERSRRRALPGALPQRAMRSCSASAIATPY